MKILIVEDDVLTQQLFCLALQSAQCEVLTAGSLSEVDALSESTVSELAAVFCDIHLPDGDGFEMARKFKESSNAKVIAMTGYSEEYLREKNGDKSWPFDLILSKPLEVSSVEEIVDSLKISPVPACLVI